MLDDKTSAQEPITKPWLWVAVVAIILVGVPWYLPPGTLGVTVFDVPAWFWISIVAAVALSAICCWACLSLWDLEAHEDWSDSDDEPGPTSPRVDEGSLR